MARDPKKRLDPPSAFPKAKSVLSLGVSYFQGPFPEKPGPGFGRVARYAWGLDYHSIITERLQLLLIDIQEILGKADGAFVAVDTKPLLERSLAQQAGLGFVGKNTLLIMPRSPSLQFHVGSWIFLAEILLTLDPSLIEATKTPLGGCGSCKKCLVACPTDAFEGPYRLRAEKCISYLTIENKGAIPLDLRSKMGDWIFGCDICQEVCPFNAAAFETRWPEFKADQGVGPWISLKEIFEMDNETKFKNRLSVTPLSRPKRRGLIRNACVVAGNSGDRSLIPALRKLAMDSEQLIAEHAAWALERLA
ncbi:MAG: Epoxyqueuosine reductase [Elusimicrobia bacterium]|nr:Epoxyqueuosine reductase [Elusimicrobiota bacterium]